MIEKSGYIRLPRIKSGKFSNKKDTDKLCRHVYDKLYICANWGDNDDISLKRGQLIITVSDLIDKCVGVTRQNVRTCLILIEHSGMIKIERASKFNNNGYKITIIDYENHDLSTACGTNQQLTNNQPTTNQRHFEESTYNNSEKQCLKNGTNQQLTNNQPTTNQSITNKGIKEINNLCEILSPVAPELRNAELKPKKKKETSNAHKVWLAYNDEYKARYNREHYRESYFYKFANELLEKLSLDEVIQIIKLYFKESDSFVIENIHSIRLVSSRVNKLLQKLNPIKVDLRQRKEY